MSGLFDIEGSACARQAAEVRFTSDAALGHLRYPYIDYERRMADDEIGYMGVNLSGGIHGRF